MKFKVGDKVTFIGPNTGKLRKGSVHDTDMHGRLAVHVQDALGEHTTVLDTEENWERFQLRLAKPTMRLVDTGTHYELQEVKG